MGELVDAAVATATKPTLEILVMRVQTRFRTEDEFVAAFRRFCTDNTCFVPTTTPRTVGIETGFSIRLCDGTPMLRGLCVVLDSWETDDNPYRRPGVRLGVRTLTRETKPIFDRIRDPRLAAGSSPDIAAHAALAEELERPTIEMPPLFPETQDCTHEDAHEDAADAMDAVPLPVDWQDTAATERVQIDTVPMRAPVPTLLGVAPIAVPRTMTPRERLAMPRLTATGTQTVIVREEPVLEEAVPPAAMPPAVIIRRRSWWNRLVWRMRAWYRTRVWAWRRR
ncbi:MAG: hypothetical protein AB7T06_19455 [Kofleriaceae bacterium]